MSVDHTTAAEPDSTDKPIRYVLAWVLTRLLVFVIWWTVAPFVHGDVRYYFSSLARLSSEGPQRVLIEYPTPVIWMLGLPYPLSFDRWWIYVLWFIAAMLVLDALFARALWRYGGPGRGRAVTFWIAFVALMGPTAYLRFDLVPGILIGFAMLYMLERRSRASGVALGVGTAAKLLPIVAFPSLLAHTGADEDGARLRRHRLSTALWYFGSGGVLALASLAWAGWDRLISPLTWQSDRGLQIESIWAGLPMLVRAFGADYPVAMSKYNAYEISSPLSPPLQVASDVSMIVGALLIVAAYVVWFRKRGATPYLGIVIALAALCTMIVTNKTFSPQYLIWLGGAMAVLLLLGERAGLSPRPDGLSTGVPQPRTTARRLAVVLLVLTLLTQLVYPIFYDALIGTGAGMPFITVVLVVRNALMVAFTAWLFALVLLPRRDAS